MKKFERFIVYPLLIIALASSFLGGGVKTNAFEFFDTILARRIIILDDTSEEMITMGWEENETFKTKNGYINIYSPLGSTALKGAYINLNSKNEDAFIRISGTIPSIRIKMNESELMQLGSAMIKNAKEEKFDFPYGLIYSQNNIPSVQIGRDSGGNGLIRTHNKHGDDLVVIGSHVTKGHGLINIYDRYGEEGRSYRHDY